MQSAFTNVKLESGGYQVVMHTVRFYQTGIWIEYHTSTDPKAGMYTSDSELSHGSLRSMEESDSKGTEVGGILRCNTNSL